jgi:hypothetical protein
MNITNDVLNSFLSNIGAKLIKKSHMKEKKLAKYSYFTTF